MDFSLAGWKEGLTKIGKVFLWVAVSAVITKAIELVSNWQPSTAEFVLMQGLLNSVLAGVVKWISTKS